MKTLLAGIAFAIGIASRLCRNRRFDRLNRVGHGELVSARQVIAARRLTFGGRKWINAPNPPPPRASQHKKDRAATLRRF
jgi:hypothetical protein